jgi:hypothetical protein
MYMLVWCCRHLTQRRLLVLMANWVFSFEFKGIMRSLKGKKFRRVSYSRNRLEA